MRTITKRIVPVLIFVMFFLAGCSEKATQKNTGPIDGQPPQWAGAKNGRSCEYSHYSLVEPFMTGIDKPSTTRSGLIPGAFSTAS